MEFWVLPGLQFAILAVTMSRRPGSGQDEHRSRRRFRELWLVMIVSTLVCTVLVLLPGSPAG